VIQQATSARINQIVQAEIDKGVSPGNIVVGGFSQGGAAALHYSLRSPHALGGVMALSSWLPLRSEYPAALSSVASSIPIIFFHGTDDYVVNYAYVLDLLFCLLWLVVSYCILYIL
jgi:predicted esterase